MSTEYVHNRGRGAVLVVDDDFLLREDAALAFEAQGFEVLQAGTAEEALGMLEERADIGAVFTDVNMPGRIDGLELARVIHVRHPSVHVIVTSGQVRPAVGELPNRSRFLPKPYHPAAVATTVAALLG